MHTGARVRTENTGNCGDKGGNNNKHPEKQRISGKALAEGSRFLFPSVLVDGADETTDLQAHLRAAGMEDEPYTMDSFRMVGTASHYMDGLTEYWGCKFATVARWNV